MKERQEERGAGMKADIAIYRDEYGWYAKTVGHSRMNDAMAEKGCIRDQVLAIVLGWADPVEFK